MREERGKSEWEEPFQNLFPTLFSLCLSLSLPYLFPGDHLAGMRYFTASLI